jgi:hypothetical protein
MDVSVVIATLVGPILAVQAQKWLEPRRERDQRQRWVFRTLMATRATKLAPSHVEALNAVPVEFYGKSEPLRAILEAWKIYMDHLNANATPDQAWSDRGDDLFVALLRSMATFLGYRFDPVALRREVYFPRGHAQIETDQTAIRQGVASLLRGEKALPMEVRGWPVDTDAAETQKQIQARVLAWLNGEATPRVRLDIPDKQARPQE